MPAGRDIYTICNMSIEPWRGRLARYSKLKNSDRYIDVFQDIVTSYNSTKSRISLFRREFYERWSKEIFTIYKIYFIQNIPLYKISDCSSQHILGSFYSE